MRLNMLIPKDMRREGAFWLVCLSEDYEIFLTTITEVQICLPKLASFIVG